MPGSILCTESPDFNYFLVDREGNDHQLVDRVNPSTPGFELYPYISGAIDDGFSRFEGYSELMPPDEMLDPALDIQGLSVYQGCYNQVVQDIDPGATNPDLHAIRDNLVSKCTKNGAEVINCDDLKF